MVRALTRRDGGAFGMDFWQAIRSVFSKYGTFTGRAPRSEFWFWILFTTLAGTAAGIVDRAVDVLVGYDGGALAALWGFGTIIPFLAVCVRRLHDIDRGGWWLLLFFIPFFGGVVLIVWFCFAGTRGYHRFGANPLPPPSGPPHRERGQ
jgi:uncharacterized membrane protein YhaH (DUF805 family)